MRLHMSLFLHAAFLVNAPLIALAECREDPRVVEFDRENIIRLKSYSCTTGAQGENKIAVEFHRIADPAAGLLVEGRSTEMLKKAIGSPLLVKNEVFATYVSLQRRHGEVRDVNSFSFRMEAAGKLGSVGMADYGYGGLSDGPLAAGAFKVLLPTFGAIVAGGPPIPHSDFYPAVDEIRAIKQKTVTRGLKLFYSTRCLSSDGVRTPDNCQQYSQPKITFWRGLQMSDVRNYINNLRRYNATVGKFQDVGEITLNSLEIPATLKLLAEIGGESPWPEDFAVIAGAPELNECGGLLQFAVLLRKLVLDVMTVENRSNRTVTVDEILGSRSGETKLRAESSFGPVTGIASEHGPLILSPGQKVLVPTRVSLLPADDFADVFGYPARSALIYQRIGSNGFAGEIRHEAPNFRALEYGRSLKIVGLTVAGGRIDFLQRSANFTDVVLGWGEYSCPYLLSWDNEGEKWINHGKILHEAKARELEYTEMVSFSNLRARFRLQEREPETAFIGRTELTVTLSNGGILVLKPHMTGPATRADSYLVLHWGDTANLEFTLPPDVDQSAVEQSRLSITGYYEPYSDLKPSAYSPRERGRSTRNYCPVN